MGQVQRQRSKIKRQSHSVIWLLWLVGRYWLGRSRVHAVSSLWLATLGIMIGVATLIAVLTGMSGLQSVLTDSIEEVTAYHLQLIVETKADSLMLEQLLRQEHEVENVTRWREAPMLLNSEYGEAVIAIVRAVDPIHFMRDRRRAEIMQTFGAIRDDDLAQSGHMWIGHSFSYENGFTEGDSIQVISAEHLGSRITAQQHNFLVSAIYSLGNLNVEKNYVFIGLDPSVEGLFNSDEFFLGLKLKRKGQALSCKRQLQQKLMAMQQNGKIGRFQLRTGQEANQAFFNALHTEKLFLQILVSLIFIVVAFQIYQSTRRTVYARIPELMLLRALGARRIEVRCIFLVESLLVGLLGVGLGVLCGVVISRYINQILLGVSKLLFQTPGLIPSISTKILSSDLLVIAGSALVFSSVAGWLATRSLLQVSPMKVLRNE